MGEILVTGPDALGFYKIFYQMMSQKLLTAKRSTQQCAMKMVALLMIY